MWGTVTSWIDLPFAGVFGLLAWLPFTLTVIVLGGLGGVGALWVFGHVSDQAGIERAKRRISAHLLELRLFQDDLWVTLRAQGNVLRYNAAYLGRALVPAAVLFVPFAIVLVQIESRAAHRPLHAGEATLLRVRLDPAQTAPTQPWSLEVSSGLRVETPPLRKDRPREVVWRLRAEAPGTHRVQVSFGAGPDERSWQRRIEVDTAGRALWPSMYSSNDPQALIAPAEGTFEPGPVVEIRVDYPLAEGYGGGLSAASWWFVASSLVVGFALRGPLGVQI